MRGLAKTRSIKISLKKRAASERESVRLQPFVSSLAKNNSARPEKQKHQLSPYIAKESSSLFGNCYG
jgi:hypothetical protein